MGLVLWVPWILSFSIFGSDPPNQTPSPLHWSQPNKTKQEYNRVVRSSFILMFGLITKKILSFWYIWLGHKKVAYRVIVVFFSPFKSTLTVHLYKTTIPDGSLGSTRYSSVGHFHESPGTVDYPTFPYQEILQKVTSVFPEITDFFSNKGYRDWIETSRDEPNSVESLRTFP